MEHAPIEVVVKTLEPLSTTTHTLTPGPGGFTALVHGQGMRVDVPTFVEVNARTTIRCMEDMKQNEWEWISQGQLFRTLWEESFNFGHSGNAIPKIPPANLSDLLESDSGVVHVAGMIVQGCEAMFQGRNVFFRNPEDLLHPATEQYIAGMLQKMLKLAGRSGVVTEEAKAPENTEEVKPTAHDAAYNGPDIMSEEQRTYAREFCITWLNKHPPDKPVARRESDASNPVESSTIITAAEMLTEITGDTDTGQAFIKAVHAKYLARPVADKAEDVDKDKDKKNKKSGKSTPNAEPGDAPADT